MCKYIFLILFASISHITIAQVAYKKLITFRFLDKVEAYYVGNLKDSTYSQPAFDPVDRNYNKDSIIRIIKKELDKYPIHRIKCGLTICAIL